jgi:hypothetical protein
MGQCPKAFPLPVPGARGSRSAASEGGSVRGSPCGEPARLRPASRGPLPKRPCTERVDAPCPARRPTEAYLPRYGEGGQRSLRCCSGPRMPGSPGNGPLEAGLTAPPLLRLAAPATGDPRRCVGVDEAAGTLLILSANEKGVYSRGKKSRRAEPAASGCKVASVAEGTPPRARGPGIRHSPPGTRPRPTPQGRTSS